MSAKPSDTAVDERTQLLAPVGKVPVAIVDKRPTRRGGRDIGFAPAEVAD